MSGVPLSSQLRKICAAVEISSQYHFRFAGRLFEAGDLPVTWDRSENKLVGNLAMLLYQHAYCRHFDGALAAETMASEADLVVDLQEANASEERWQSGWRVEEIFASGGLRVRRGLVQREVNAGEFVTLQGPGVPALMGSEVRVFQPGESLSLQPGLYFVFGEACSAPLDLTGLVRFYWNVRGRGAVRLVREISRRLNHFQVPFRFKCATSNLRLERSDSGVLYVDQRYFAITARIVSEVLGVLDALPETKLIDATPLFSKELAPGLAVAEDPADGDSFGALRCRQLAEGLFKAFENGASDLNARWEIVEAHFAEAGVRLDAAHLTPGSTHEYELPEAMTA